MHLLAIDVGSSSIKAAVMNGPRLSGAFAHEKFKTRYTPEIAEVQADDIAAAIGRAVRSLGSAVKTVDLIAATVMAPSWLAIDGEGRALTPVVTHQDRRSIDFARAIEKRIGKAAHLRITGNRPFPGGISSTTAAWFKKHQPDVMKKATLVGHFNTYLLHAWTGERLTDPSSASFTGLYETCKLSGWSERLCESSGVKLSQLPRVVESNEVAGAVTRDAARRFGLPPGVPVLAGCMDTSAAMFAIGTEPGRLLNVCGSTDVLCTCTDQPHPHERLLTRALGVGKRWMSISTLAAVGTAIKWIRETMFADVDDKAFYNLVDHPQPADPSITFEPYLAGERTCIEQRRGAFTGLTLSTTREQMLAAMLAALGQASADRLPLLRQVRRDLKRDVTITGGSARGTDDYLHRDWGKGWRFTHRQELTARGLAQLATMANDR